MGALLYNESRLYFDNIIFSYKPLTYMHPKWKHVKSSVNIWKSYIYIYMCTAVEEKNTEVILTVMNTTELVVEIRPEKIFVV